MLKNEKHSRAEINSGEAKTEHMGTNNAPTANSGQGGAQSSSLSACALPGVLIYIRLGLCALLIVLSQVLKISSAISLVILLAAAVVAGYDLVIKAAEDLQRRNFLGESLPMLLAVILCFVIGRGFEGTISLFILQAAFIVRSYALSQTRKQLLDTVGIAEAVFAAGGSPEGCSIRPGDSFALTTGEIAPTDCTITHGEAIFDLSFITGDHTPVTLGEGRAVFGGCLCLEGRVMAQADSLPEVSAAAKIADLINGGSTRTTAVQMKILSASQYFVPAILLVGILALILLPLKFNVNFDEALRRIITILSLVSPGAILLSVPMSYLSGMVLSRKIGCVVKSAQSLETLAATGAAAINKNGAVTGGLYSVSEIRSDKMDAGTFLKVAAFAAYGSDDPMYTAVCSAFGEKVETAGSGSRLEFPGKGISVNIDGIQILLGTDSFLAQHQVSLPQADFSGSVLLHMSVNGLYAGCIIMSETMNPGISDTIRKLRKLGIDRVSMLSNDSPELDRTISEKLGISEYYADCTDGDRVKVLSDIKAKISEKSSLIYVSADLNSARPFAAADAGVALTPIFRGADFGQQDVSILSGSIFSLPKLISIARTTLSCITIKLLVGLFVKLVLTVLAVLGIAPLWFALVIDNCCALALIISSLGRAHHEAKHDLSAQKSEPQQEVQPLFSED